jgi:hypothetical protein
LKIGIGVVLVIAFSKRHLFIAIKITISTEAKEASNNASAERTVIE